eukprot:136745_1
MATAFKSLPHFPLSVPFERNTITASPHLRHSNCFLITSTHDYSNPGVYEYNIETNQLNFISDYGTIGYNIIDAYHAQFLDTVNDVLYIIGYAYLHAFNWNTKRFTLVDEQIQSEIGPTSCFPRIVSIPSPTNQICIFNNDSYELKTLQFAANKPFRCISTQLCKSLRNEFVQCPKLIYVPFKKQLMIFGSDGDDTIWKYHETEMELWNGLWKQLDVTMPCVVDDDRDYDVVLAFEYLLFVLYYTQSGVDCGNRIHCFDLLNECWFDTKMKVPKSVHYGWSLKTKCNDIHIVDCNDNNRFKISLHDLIPKALIRTHRKRYDPLITGYIKEQETQLTIPSVPFVLKQLILNLFPLFTD